MRECHKGVSILWRFLYLCALSIVWLSYGDPLFFHFTFSTVTNVNFDGARFHEYYIPEALRYRDELKTLYEETCRKNGKSQRQFDCNEATWTPDDSTMESIEALHQEGFS